MDADVTSWIALLRGINLGGKRKVAMPALADAFRDLGAEDPRTYLNSGNVVFRAPHDLAQELPARFEALSPTRFGFGVPLVLRSLPQLRATVAGNPFLGAGADERTLHVMFLARPPASDAAAKLDPQRSPPDGFAVRGAEVYLHLPNGMARTRLTNAYLDSTLGTTSTARTWRTVKALLALAEG